MVQILSFLAAFGATTLASAPTAPSCANGQKLILYPFIQDPNGASMGVWFYPTSPAVHGAYDGTFPTWLMLKDGTLYPTTNINKRLAINMADKPTMPAGAFYLGNGSPSENGVKAAWKGQDVSGDDLYTFTDAHGAPLTLVSCNATAGSVPYDWNNRIIAAYSYLKAEYSWEDPMEYPANPQYNYNCNYKYPEATTITA